MAERASDRWVSIVLSVLLHGILAAAVAYGFWTYRQSRPPTATLAIEATVVDARSVNGAALQSPPQPRPPAPEPPPAAATEPVEPTGPPQPTPEEIAQRQRAEQDQAQKEQERKLDEQKQQQEAQRQAEQERQRLQMQREEQEKAEAERKAADVRKRAEEQRATEQKRADAAQREADERARAELQSSLVAEEHANTVRNSGALTSWLSQITARIQRAWLRPPSARAGVQCVLHVTQAPGGTVTNVSIGECNGDQAVRESIEAAAYRASPLPPPPDPSLFERDLEITFRPD
jgi:colicin import membrane protein